MRALAVTSCCDAKSSGIFSVSLPSLQPCYQPRAGPPPAICCKQALNWSLANGMVSLGQFSHWEWGGMAQKEVGTGAEWDLQMDLRARPWLASSCHMPCKCTNTEANATPSYFLQCLPEMGRWVLPECWTQGPCFCKSSVMVWMLASNWTKGYEVPKYFQTVPHKSSPASIKRPC